VDIYSLGVVLYELLTGALPLGRFKLPSETGVQGEGLDSVVLKTLERSPQDRYQHVSEVNADISRVSQGHSQAVPNPERAAAIASVQNSPNEQEIAPEEQAHSGLRPRKTIPEVVRQYDPGFVLSGTVLALVGLGLLSHGLLTGEVTMWIGIGIALNGFTYFTVAFQSQSMSSGPNKDQPRKTLASPNMGVLIHGFSMLWVGTVLCPAGFHSAFGWVGMGLMIGGGHLLIGAWVVPKKGKKIPAWSSPDYSGLIYAGGMMLIGSILLIAGILSGHGALPWVGLGLTLGGGAIAHTGWAPIKEED